jgi:opacity protein-like surface antigen
MPYLSARLAYLKESLSDSGTDAEASGYLFGFGGGLGFQVSPTVTLGGSLTYNIVNFGDVEVDGTTLDDSSASGSSLAVRFAVGFKFR